MTKEFKTHKDSDVRYDHQGFESTPVDEEYGGHDVKDDKKVVSDGPIIDWFERSDLADQPESTNLTKGGFHKFDLDIDLEDIEGLVNKWAHEHLSEASLEQYTEVFEDTNNQSKALYGAIINEIIIDVLKFKIAEIKTEIDDNSADV